MFALLGVALALTQQVQVQVVPSSRRPPVVRDSIGDSTRADGRHRRRGIRRPVTVEDRATAFKDAGARTTMLHARAARMTQDSTLKAYDAMAYERISAGLGFRAIGRDRLIFRQETAARVQWQQGVGVWIEARGRRTAVPVIGNEDAKREIRDEIDDSDLDGPIPYFPGYEPLWVGSDVARAQVDESEIVNPIADGAEAYYTYATGDSIRFKLPNGTTIRLREIRVRPRQPQWNLAVGSLWFDTSSGLLVRAAYRLSVPIDVWAVAKADDPTSMDDVPVWVKPMITPMRAEVSAIAVEYGLHEGRFWLPRVRVAEGRAQVSFMHVPFKMEQRFTYASVNGTDTLPAIAIATPPSDAGMPDSLTIEQQSDWRDSVRADRRERRRARRDSVRRGLLAPEPKQCDTADTRIVTARRYDSSLPIAVRIPCDVATLEHSPDLPGSIYDPGDVLFGDKELDALKSEALSMTAQAPFQFRLRAGLLPPPVLAYGPSMMRYNRVEGLSLGASVEQQFGGGYSGTVVARLGVADWEPNVELGARRSNVSRTIGLSAYNHLVSASDWGTPLSFGSSFSALMFGRDEGFYYRSTGVELSGANSESLGDGARIEWRAFAERQRSAAVETNFSVSGGDFPANLVARHEGVFGLAARVRRSHGLDPAGLRVFTDLRLETAAGDSLYGRGALDVTVSHGLGPMAGALTVSGGSSLGGLPPQRMWYLGGSQTVRGQSPDTLQRGNAFWLGRAELGTRDAGIRPALFADIGWVGDRARMREVGRPLSGVGVGVSFLDGLFRFDVARGINPRRQTRVDLYLESKF